jgi:hypothetical protein
MAVGEFQKQCNLTSKAYSNFMSQNGPSKGSGSSVYMAAWAFFKKREMKGIKLKPNKKVKASESATKPVDEGMENVVLEGEMEDNVPVFGKSSYFFDMILGTWRWGGAKVANARQIHVTKSVAKSTYT